MHFKNLAPLHMIKHGGPVPHRLVVADGVKLSAEHDGGEGEEEERLHAEEDHQ